MLLNARVDEQLRFLDDNLRYFCDKYIPIKSKSMRNIKPWFTSEVRSLTLEAMHTLDGNGLELQSFMKPLELHELL